MNKRKYYIIAIICLVLVIIGSAFYIISGERKGSGVYVTTARAEISGGNETPALSGKLEVQQSANVVSKITGRVGSVNIDIGSRVKAGDVLVTLDANELAASVNQAEAAVGVARYNYDAAQIDYETAKLYYERNKILYEQGAISQVVFENTYAQPFKKAEHYAKYGADAALQAAVAALDLARANYANSIITSPIDGIVTAKNINPGELATTSVTLVTVVNLDKVFLQTAVDESYINKLKEGDTLPVKVAAVSDQPFTGVISNISQAASTSSKGFTVKVLIENAEHLLKPGMFAEASLSAIDRSELMIPKSAVINEGGHSYVWVVENGTVSKREVVKGTSSAVKTGIKAGLKEGQEVATSGLEQLKEGMRVNIMSVE
ncbi:efflux RND transporter periplasmic adaptor subunit [Pelotomaculum propionicicum]|uniref:Efflux pump periplasmic linker BepF n=1 Tax=Pelotomaculum propionicicum TaxID=258475 RepID=A0A4Y7RPL9_9FIRM|nr:efflux RND transporter periplasmic adaptor subunit [Pelotomaculum propionicicum]NLI12427.1 efflux RND transporter periplasmic adaptor subunit [Peptococcaceae bacterium]TEB10964.1 Efflux pump periplasmic linker BepF [Pelotomaculum propionicicum]